MTFDRAREMRLRTEHAVDRSTARFGRCSVAPAALLHRAA